MKNFTLFLLSVLWLSFPLRAQVAYNQPNPVPATDSSKDFTSVTALQPLTISSHTAEMPQAKVWTHGGKWWTVLATATGTKLFRLDGTAWTEQLTLSDKTNPKADCLVVGDVAHVVLFRKATSTYFASYLSSLEYDAAAGTYKPWSQRPTNVTLGLDSTTETATVAVDGNGRMWIATDARREVHVQWSDAPYATWSAPITISPKTDDDDMCAIAALPGKIGVFWSNQKERRFGFKTHADGADPAQWSNDEVPGGGSVLNIGKGIADNHVNLMVASNGTLYAAVKTSYDTPGYPNIALLVRRSSGSWDSLHTVTSGDGTRPIVLLNEKQNRLKVVYTSASSGGDIRYRESSASLISFGPEKTLFAGAGMLNFASSTHQAYSSEVLVMATNMSASPVQAVGVLLTDMAVADPGDQPLQFTVYPNPSAGGNTIVAFTLAEDDQYTLNLYDMRGAKLAMLGQGVAMANQLNSTYVDGSRLLNGMYLVELRTSKLRYTYKIIVRR